MGVRSEMWNRAARQAAVIGLVLVAWPGAGLAEEEAPSGAPTIGLDKLMKLPDSYGAQAMERRGKGLSADQWRDRFAAAQREVVRAEKDLKNAQAALEKVAGSTSSWQVSAPGLVGGGGGIDADNAPVSFRLREAVRMRKLALEEARRAQRDLVVEANLAGVPEGWRHPEEKTRAPADSATSR